MSIVLFTTKNKQNPLNPVQLSNRKNPAEAWIKGRSCSCHMASNMGCVRALLYRALKKQRVEMTAAERNSVLSIGAHGKMQNEQTAWEPECVISSEGSRYSTYLCNLHCELQFLTHHIVNLRYHMPGFIWIQHRECTLCVSFSMFCRVDVCFHDILLLFATCSTRSRHISKGTYPKRPYMAICSTCCRMGASIS